MSLTPYGRQTIEEDDIEAIVNVLRSDYLTQGPRTPEFENAVMDEVGVSNAVAVNSATSALHIAMLALDVGPGDEVWVPAITFVATANAALYCGADVNFIDIDPGTFNLSMEDLEQRLTRAKRHRRLPKVVVAVHMGGVPSNLSRLRELSRNFGFFVVEDASHAVGSFFDDAEIGACVFSDITVFSFHPVKIVTSGEGGMATTNDDDLASRMARFRSHGITREFGQFDDKQQGSWHYEQHDLGYNYRLPELSAVLGQSQFRKRHGFIALRREVSRRYKEALPDMTFQEIPQGSTSSHHLEVILVSAGQRRGLFEHLRTHGIGVNLHYAPVFTQPYYRALRDNWGSFPNAMAYYSQAISLPIYPLLEEETQARVIDLIRGHQGS